MWWTTGRHPGGILPNDPPTSTSSSGGGGTVAPAFHFPWWGVRGHKGSPRDSGPKLITHVCCDKCDARLQKKKKVLSLSGPKKHPLISGRSSVVAATYRRVHLSELQIS